MGAIINNSDYRPGECILCMDCLYDCPQHATRFGWKRSRIPPVNDDHPSHGISRRQFLLFGSSSVLLSGFQMRKRHRHSREISPVIRPPGSLAEEHFCDRCIRCGNCMKVCITNGLQPVMLESGLAGIWTPQLLPTIGYCEYNCTLCGQVCPTNAIPQLPVEKKRKMRLGLANINRRTCWPWAEGKECIVCEEHCPIPDKAIYLQSEKHGSTTILKPYVNPKTCNGCGICQTKCPARPFRAIQVASFPSDRT